MRWKAINYLNTKCGGVHGRESEPLTMIVVLPKVLIHLVQLWIVYLFLSIWICCDLKKEKKMESISDQ